MSRVYDIVTERIVELLEEGTVPWHKPWDSALTFPRSLATGKPYRGINVWLLSCTPYESPWWGTYRQVSEHGGQVRRGERSTLVVLWKPTKRTVTDAETGEEGERDSLVLRYFRVFNAEQCEGLLVPEIPGSHHHEPIAHAEAIIDSYLGRECAPALAIGGGIACYIPPLDVLRMAPREAFHSAEEYVSTMAHELVHSTGHESRLGRKELLDPRSFGNPSYCREELVAEMGAAMLCARVGVAQVTLPASAAYIRHWIDALRGDSRLVVSAAAAAQKAVDYIVGADDDEGES